MSAASIAREAGFATLLQVDGEDLEFREDDLRAIVNLPQEDAGAGPGRVRFHERDSSIIEFLASAIAGGDPKAGETFTDEAGLKHTIQTWRRNGANLVCTCSVST